MTTKNPKDLTHLVSRTNRTLKTKLMDRRAIATVLSLFSAQDTHAPSSDWSNMNNYNTVVLNREIFSGMMKTGQQAPLRAHCLEFLRQADSHRVFQHRGEIIREIKDRLKLDPPQWRYFCKAARIRSVSDLLPMNIPRMAMACQALVDANRPQAHPQQLHQIWQRQHDHEAFHKAAWRHGDPWKAWTGLLNQYLAPSEIPRSAEDLNLITDALRHHVQNQLPWGPGNWAILLTRSERWHVENFQRHGRGRYYALPKEGQDASWTSLVDLVNIDGLSFAPVTNGPRLAFLGSRMGNCLATYWSSCNQGISRIFTATSNGSLHAAVQLVNNHGHWAPGQAQAPHGKNLDKGIYAAISKLAKAYQAAYDSSRTEAGRQAPKQHSPQHPGHIPSENAPTALPARSTLLTQQTTTPAPSL